MAAADSNEPGKARIDLTIQRIDVICDGFELAWQQGQQPQIEDFLKDSTDDSVLLRELLALEIDYLQRSSQPPNSDDYRTRFPDQQTVIDELFAEGSTAVQASARATDTLPMSTTDATSSSENSRTAGTTFADYELLEEIARGGMGVVYRAVQKSVNRVVALKMILTGQLASDEEVQRFRSEAKAAAILDHPNIVPVFDVGEHDGRHYFSMGYVDGESLSDLLRDGPLAPNEAAKLIRTIADAVECAHEHGVIHRDLKPSNILIDRNGSPRVTDFGLARQLNSDSNLTATGQVMGTPSYMPPEQAAGDSSQVDARSDLYSLGAILYSLVTGRPPFQAAHVVETLRQVMNDQPVEPRVLNSAVDRDLETICLKCLAKEPRQRYQRVRELSDELDRYLDGKPIVARSITRRERLWRWCRRNRLMASMISTSIVSLFVGTGVSIYFAVLAGQRADQAEAGIRVALTALESTIDKIQNDLRFIPAARQVRRELLREAVVSLQKVSGQVQTQDRVDRNTANALVELGLLFVQLGDDEGLNSLATAESNFRSAVRIFREIVPPNEIDAELLRDKSWAMCEYGSFLLDRRQLDDAEVLLKEALDIRRQLHERFPDDAGCQFRLSVSFGNWSDLLAMRRDFEGAIRHSKEALQLAEASLVKNPDNTLIRDHVAQFNEKTGDAYHDLRDNDRALPYFEKSLGLTLAMLKDDPDSSQVHDSLSFCYERLGNHWLQTGDANQALDMYLKMEDATKQAIEGDPQNRLLQEGLVVVYKKIAKAHRAMGRREEAAAAQRAASGLRRELGAR